MQSLDLLLKRLSDGGAPSVTDQASLVLRTACQIAGKFGHRSVTPEHLLMALTSVERVIGRALLESMGLDVTAKGAEIAALLPPRSTEQVVANLEISPEAERLLDAACGDAKLLGHRFVGTEHLLLGLLSCGDCAATRYWQRQGITAANVHTVLRTGKPVPQKPTATFIRLQPASETTDPADALHSVPWYRRVVIGLCALISGLILGLFGFLILGGAFFKILARGQLSWRTLVAETVGGGLAIVSVFLFVVWLRLWFGSRPWLDRTINRLYPRVSWFLVILMAIFLAFVAVNLFRG